MKLFKTTLAFLIFFFILACGQNPERQARNSNNVTPVTRMPEAETEVVQNNEETEENVVVNDSTTEAEGEQPQNESVQQKSQVDSSNSDAWNKPQNSGLDWWMVGAIASFVVNVFLFLLLLKTVNSKEKYRLELNDIEIGKNKYKNKASMLSSKLKDLERKNSNVLRRKQANSSNQYHSNSPKKEQSFDDEKSPEVVLSVDKATVPSPPQEIKQPVYLFAEKATEKSTFSSVSDQKNEHRTIFKLSLENEKAETAKFEVIDSDFILKMAANSPDTYLYSVCNPENSNQNFSGEIITTKRGVAHKVDGKWKVNDENKATIKFK